MPRFRMMAAVAAAALLAVPAFAQTPPQPALPAPALDANSTPQAFIQAARQALASGHVGEAQEAIERAESRALTRAVKPSTAAQPSQQPLVEQLSAARQALASGDRVTAAQILDQAANNPEAGK